MGDTVAIRWSSAYHRSIDESCGDADVDETPEQPSVMLPSLTPKEGDEGLK